MIHDLSTRLPGGRFLDIGCGNKPYLAWFSHASSYFGVDIASINSLADVVAHVTFLPFDSDSFDCAVCFQVIEHVENPSAVLAEARRVLKPNGHLLLSAPLAWRQHEEPYDFYRYTRFGLQYLLESAGFEILFLEQAGGAWRAVGHSLACAIDASIRGRIWKPARNLAVLMTNTLFAWLDRANFQSQDTCNLVVLGRKIS